MKFRTVKSRGVEITLFSVNLTFNLLPVSEDMNDYFVEEYGETQGELTQYVSNCISTVKNWMYALRL